MSGEFPSLDGMTIGDLAALKGQLKHVIGTIEEKIMAQELRLAGRIGRARQIEAIVERRIEAGPDWAKY